MSYKDDTVKIAKNRLTTIGEEFLAEVEHLLKSGSVDPENHSRNMVFGVALENLADGYLRGYRDTEEYRNLKRA